jgi:hypothetical protein
VSDCRTQTVFRDVKVFESATNKNAGGVDRVIERVFAIYEENTKAPSAEEPRAVQAGQPGANDDDVIMFHWFCGKELTAFQSDSAQRYLR